jgi:hypothetical protein
MHKKFCTKNSDQYDYHQNKNEEFHWNVHRKQKNLHLIKNVLSLEYFL